MDYLKSIQPISQRSESELWDLIPVVSQHLIDALNKLAEQQTTDLSLECLKLLKACCARGAEYQSTIVSDGDLLDAIDSFLTSSLTLADVIAATDLERLQTSCFQLLANATVRNAFAQERVLERFHDWVFYGVASSMLGVSNACCAIVHSALLNDDSPPLLQRRLKQVTGSLLRRVEGVQQMEDFWVILLDFLVCEYRDVDELYEKLEYEERTWLLAYITEHLSGPPTNAPIRDSLFRRLVADFKKASERILKWSTTDDKIKPNEVLGLLNIISVASGHEVYSERLRKDGSLFINVGMILKALHDVGKQDTGSIFAPLNKLYQVAPAGPSGDASFEQEVSYSIKTRLVKTLANLLYRNMKNQETIRELGIVLTLLECTNIDARNPTMKEYAILAIRNMCEGNKKNQEFIASLNKNGDVPSAIVTEMTESIVRIAP